ncbi:MAG: Gfo/Idh/MocA family oxidoreductase [Burkholderiales bacterium]
MDRCVGICIIGVGRAGMIHARNFQFNIANARVVSVSDSSEEACKAACQELQIDSYYLDYKEAIKDKNVDAVVVVAPTKLHCDIVTACAKAKKNVFCEKPMAVTVQECESMIKACSDNNVKLQLGFMRRFDKSMMKAREAIKSGVIGDIVHIRSITRGPSKPREWMYDISVSNGPLAEVNSHDIDCIRWITDSEFDFIFANAGNYRNPEIREKYPDFYDNVVMCGKLKNGVQFTIEGAQYVQYGYDVRVEVLGTKGVMSIGRSDADDVKVVRNDRQNSSEFIHSWIDLYKEAYLEEDKHFINSILNDTEPKVKGHDGKMAVKVVQAGNESISTSRVIKL